MNLATLFLVHNPIPSANAVFGLSKGHPFSPPMTRLSQSRLVIGGKGDDPRSGGLVTLLVGARMPPSPRKWSARQRGATSDSTPARRGRSTFCLGFPASANSWACLPYLNRLRNNDGGLDDRQSAAGLLDWRKS